MVSGHTFLEGKWLIEIKLNPSPFKQTPLNLSHPASYKLTLQSEPEVGMPYSIVLPMEEDPVVFTFLVDPQDIPRFRLYMDLYPTFGTRVLGRAMVTPSLLGLDGQGVENTSFTCPLMDSNLKWIGDVGLSAHVTQPFLHPHVKIGGMIQTYWKSTWTRKVDPSSHAAPHAQVQHFITASSLLEEYLFSHVHVTCDHVPILYACESISIACAWGHVTLPISSLTWLQVKSCVNVMSVASLEGASLQDMAHHVQTACVTLEDACKVNKTRFILF
jgi:CDK inhibitor PHO81